MDKKNLVKNIFDKISKNYDITNDIISFGLRRIWERKFLKLIKENKKEYDCVLDLCTGTGTFLKSLNKISKNLYGLDISKNMLRIAEEKIKNESKTINLVLGEAENLPFENEKFDLITISYGVRNFYDLKKGLEEVNRVSQKGGDIFILEFGKIRNKLWNKIFSLYFSFLMPLISRILKQDKESYKYLSTTSLNFPSGSEFEEILIDSNIKCEKCYRLLGGVVYIYKCQNK